MDWTFPGSTYRSSSDETVVLPEVTEEIGIQKAEVHRCLHKKKIEYTHCNQAFEAPLKKFMSDFIQLSSLGFFYLRKTANCSEKNNEKYFRNILIRTWTLDSCVKSNVT